METFAHTLYTYCIIPDAGNWSELTPAIKFGEAELIRGRQLKMRATACREWRAVAGIPACLGMIVFIQEYDTVSTVAFNYNHFFVLEIGVYP